MEVEYLKYLSNNSKSFIYNMIAMRETNYNKKFEYLKLASEEKDCDGYVYNDLGFCYKHGHGCGKDYVKMFYYWNLGLNKGYNGMIYNNMATCYEKGIGCDKDEKRAFECYKLATEQKYVTKRIYMNLAICYKDGIGCDKNISEYNKYMDLKGKHTDPVYEIDKVISLYEQIDNLKKTIDELNAKVNKLNEHIIELEHSPNPGIKFMEAKQEFENLSK